MPTTRWGILGPGRIAEKFAKAVAAVPEARLTAVASRDGVRARAFAERFAVARAHDSYQALANDDDVDAIYVATPHTGHHRASLLCLEAGKAVLVEKPIAVNARQAGEMVAAAHRRKVFFMEALWTRFLPVMADIRSWLDGGRIGELRMLRASFGFRCGWDPRSRLLDPDLAGGGLLDVGVYPIAFACWAFGNPPDAVAALGHLGESGVDEQTGVLLRFPGGGLAVLDCAVRTNTEHSAFLLGTDGKIRVHAPFWSATAATLVLKEETPALRPFTGNGFEYQIAEVGRCLAAGLLESPGMSHADSLTVMRICDEVRRQIGLRYPCESESSGA